MLDEYDFRHMRICARCMVAFFINDIDDPIVQPHCNRCIAEMARNETQL